MRKDQLAATQMERLKDRVICAVQGRIKGQEKPEGPSANVEPF